MAPAVAGQVPLPFAPPPQPVPPVVDQRVPADERRSLASDNAIVLAALRRGPLSGRELEQLLGPGSAWRTRVSDVRQRLRMHGETVTCRRVEPRLYVYSIEALS